MAMGSWKILACGGQRMLARMRNLENGGCEITVSNVLDIWREVLTKEDLVKRCKELNRRLEAPSESIVQHIQQTLSMHDPDVFSTSSDSADNEILNVKMKNSFKGGIPFVWEFRLKRLKGREFTDAFLSPMMKVISSLQCANEQLIKIIVKKDSEIRDYKDSGGKVSRPYLETMEFKAEDFDQELRASAEYNTAIGKDIFSIVSARSTNTRLCEVESDIKNPQTTALSSGMLVTSQSKSPVAKVVARGGNRRMLNNRRPPKGVNASDSDSSTNDEVSSPRPVVKRSNEENPKKVTKKKKVVDKRKKLF